ncbi:MAG: DNA-binding domain-containing protein [Xenococcaceae cyanobacterium]
MAKPQITIRISSTLLKNLENHVEQSQSTKTEIVVEALVKYLSHSSNLSLTERIANLEKQIAELKVLIRSIKCG